MQNQDKLLAALSAKIEIPEEEYEEAFSHIEKLYLEKDINDFLAMMAINFVLTHLYITQLYLEIPEEDKEKDE